MFAGLPVQAKTEYERFVFRDWQVFINEIRILPNPPSKPTQLTCEWFRSHLGPLLGFRPTDLWATGPLSRWSSAHQWGVHMKRRQKKPLRNKVSKWLFHYLTDTAEERTLSWVLRCLSSFGRRISSRPCFSWASASSMITSSGRTSVRVKLPQKSSRWK